MERLTNVLKAMFLDAVDLISLWGSMMVMRLYTHPRSPFARKVMMLAQIHNITLEYDVVDYLDPEHGYTAVSYTHLTLPTKA